MSRTESFNMTAYRPLIMDLVVSLEKNHAENDVLSACKSKTTPARFLHHSKLCSIQRF